MDASAYLLRLLDEEPRHGYEVIRLRDRMGVYAPRQARSTRGSPGSRKRASSGAGERPQGSLITEAGARAAQPGDSSELKRSAVQRHRPRGPRGRQGHRAQPPRGRAGGCAPSATPAAPRGQDSGKRQGGDARNGPAGPRQAQGGRTRCAPPAPHYPVALTRRTSGAAAGATGARGRMDRPPGGRANWGRPRLRAPGPRLRPDPRRPGLRHHRQRRHPDPRDILSTLTASGTKSSTSTPPLLRSPGAPSPPAPGPRAAATGTTGTTRRLRNPNQGLLREELLKSSLKSKA
jgi:hypothetical protein